MSTRFLVLMTDECGQEFSEYVTADDRENAYEIARDSWPESQIVSIESPGDVEQRELHLYASVMEDDYDYAEDY
jgi:hypothetical protein